MALFDDVDPDQFQDSGGILGRLLSWMPNASQSGGGSDLQGDPYAADSPQAPTSSGAGSAQAVPPPPDLGTRLGAGLQSWAQTPVGSPFAALANGINGFNNGQSASPAGAATASSNAPPASAPAQKPNFGDRLGAAFQSWAQTPVGSLFAGLANGITGFNTGQVSVAPAGTKTQSQTQDFNDRPNASAQNPPTVPIANSNLQMLLGRPRLGNLSR